VQLEHYHSIEWTCPELQVSPPIRKASDPCPGLVEDGMHQNFRDANELEIEQFLLENEQI
jgi:hypothetical protein